MRITVEESRLEPDSRLKPEEPEKQERQISLADKEIYTSRIDEQIKTKKNMLLKQNDVLRTKKKENHFLKQVHADYEKYFRFIKDEKEKQIQIMNVLNNYLNDIIENGKLTDEDIEETKQEQSEIIKSIDAIKGDLDKIILE